MLNACNQEQLYLIDSYFDSVPTEVVETGSDESTTWVVLAQNIFHPQGGGQPADSGNVDGVDATPFKVGSNRSVIALRLEDSDATFAAGQRVQSSIDIKRRCLHSALHTAGHVVQAIAESRGWTVVANNHFPGQARVEFRPTTDDLSRLSDEEFRTALLSEFQDAVDETISKDLAVTADENEHGFRTVRLGDWHATPCGGTHVHHLSQLNDFRISSLKLKKGTVRVAYDAAHSPQEN